MLSIFIGFTLSGHAREPGSWVNDTLIADTMQASKREWAVFIELGRTSVPVPSGKSRESSVAFGIKYKKLSAGFSSSVFNGTIEKKLIFPNDFQLDYAHGGAFVAYRLYRVKWLNMSVNASFQKGDMTWERLDPREYVLRDKFNFFTAGAEIEVDFMRYVRPYAIIGYQKMSGLNLSNTTGKEFSDIFFTIGLRVGYFN